MIKKTSKLLMHLFLIVTLIGMSALEAQAGDDKRRGSAGAAQLLVPVTARHASLGASLTGGMANLNGLEALAVNPAGLALNTGTSAMFSRMEYVADIGVNYFGIAQRIGNNQVAFTINAWDFGDIPLQTENTPDVNDLTFNVSFITAAFSYARQFTDRIAAGVTLKAVSENIDDITGTAVAFDAGMTYVVGETGLRLGVSLSNIGSDMTYDGTALSRSATISGQAPDGTLFRNSVKVDAESMQLPSLLNFGVSYARQVGAGAVVTVLGNYRSNSFDQDQYAGGIEVGLMEVLYLRGGFEVVGDSDLTFWQSGNFGAGLNLEFSGTQLTFDYAYRPTNSFFDDVQMFTLGVTL